jgi:lysophospholipase L1-like esterase
VPLLFAATLPPVLRALPVIGNRLRELLDPAARERALAAVGASLREVGHTVRNRAPQARIMFVDYLTLLPPAGTPAPPLPDAIADLGRHVADRLADITAEAARETGCEVVRAAQASRAHHAWSADPWTVGAGSLLPWRPKPFHPNAEGMRVVADLIVEALSRS